MELIVAQIGRPHGVRGEVSLEIRSDRPEQRLVPGAVWRTDPASAGPLTLTRVRHDAKGWFALFAEIADRTQAQAARGARLLVETDLDEAADDEPDAWYPHQLEGLPAVLPDGAPAGVITGVDASPAHDLLRVREADGSIALVPLVRAIVLEVDLVAGRVVLDPPGGLLAARPAAGE